MATQRETEPPKVANPMLDPTSGDEELDIRVSTLWRTARLGPNVERLRRHVLRDGEHQMDAAQFRALDTVVAAGPLTVGDLTERLGVDPASVTRTVNRLEADGWVAKQRSNIDRRAVQITVTPAGRTHHQYFATRARNLYRVIFADFAPQEKALLADYLERMLKATDVALATQQNAADRAPLDPTKDGKQ